MATKRCGGNGQCILGIRCSYTNYPHFLAENIKWKNVSNHSTGFDQNFSKNQLWYVIQSLRTDRKNDF